MRLVDSVTLDGKALDAGDYVVEKGATEGSVRVALTAAGLKKAEAAQTKEFKVVFKATFSDINKANAAGTFQNDAKLYVKVENTPLPPDTPPTPPDNPPTTPKVTSNWGKLKLHKYDAAKGETESKLADAEFEIYNAKDPYADNCAGDGAVAAGEALNVTSEGASAPAKTHKTDANGNLEFKGLFVSDSEGTDTENQIADKPAGYGKDKTFRCYVLKEVKAPAGYTLPSGDAAFTSVKVQTGLVTETAGAAKNYVEISNTKSTIPQLPLTGANGRILLSVIGIGLLCLAGGTYVARSRKTKRS